MIALLVDFPAEALAFVFAFVSCAVLLPAFLPLYRRFGLVDKPNARSAHSRVTPRGVGLVVAGCFWLSILGVWLLAPGPVFDAVEPWGANARLGAFVIASALLVTAGFVDDVWRLSAVVKLFLQCACACALVGVGFVTPLPDMGGGLQPWLEGGVTVIWLVGVVNAVNFVDGSDGYCTTLSALCASLFVALSFLVPPVDAHALALSHSVQVVGLAAVGTALPFLFFNLAPARCFLGDTGSMFFGFILGLLAVLMTQNARVDATSAAAVAVSPWETYRFLVVPWLVLLVPIGDAVRVAVARLRSGRSPFQPDNTHLHHLFQRWGLSANQMVVAVALLSTCCGLTAAYILCTDCTSFLVGTMALAAVFVAWFVSCSYRARRLLTRLVNNYMLLRVQVPRVYQPASAFKEQAEQELSRAARRALPASLAVVTVGGRQIETPGASPLENPKFLEGLLEVSRHEDVKGRLGTDRLAFLLVETDKAVAYEVLARVHERFASIRRGESQDLQFGIGLATFPEDAETFSALLELACDAAVAHLEAGAEGPAFVSEQTLTLEA